MRRGFRSVRRHSIETTTSSSDWERESKNSIWMVGRWFFRAAKTSRMQRRFLRTGARPIRLSVPGTNLDGVLTLRTAEDADVLKAEIKPGRRVAIIGGGYIGLEVAASVSALGGTAVVMVPSARCRVAHVSLEHRPKALKLEGVDAIQCI